MHRMCHKVSFTILLALSTPSFPVTTLLTTLLLYCYDHHRDLHSFPTRRSSDLHRPREPAPEVGRLLGEPLPVGELRSEEHTSELQSLTNLVCRLLLEKKKKTMSKHVSDATSGVVVLCYSSCRTFDSTSYLLQSQ